MAGISKNKFDTYNWVLKVGESVNSPQQVEVFMHLTFCWVNQYDVEVFDKMRLNLASVVNDLKKRYVLMGKLTHPTIPLIKN